MILPSTCKIGIIGGGQLGKMMFEQTARWNLQFHFLDSADAPCEKYATRFINAALTDREAIRQLATISDVISYEIEHVNTEALIELQLEGKKIYPYPQVLQIIQDKGKQKQFLERMQIPVVPYVMLQTEQDWQQGISRIQGEKIVLKSRTGGYDGKGVEIVEKKQLSEGYRPFKSGNALAEKCITGKEIAVIVAVDTKGNTQYYPPVQMVFDEKSHLVLFLHTELDITEDQKKKCIDISLQSATAFASPGLFAIELFVTETDVYVNEIAPRPHNSGHHTIEACYTSQFEQMVRILLEMPLGSTALIQPAAMINIVGPEEVFGSYVLEKLDILLEQPGIYVHLYGKKESRPHRKLGHITIVAPNKEELFNRVKKAEMLRVIAAP
jgi:5-(carboxyamino)imidazole ribonucleotide synthase